MGQWDVSCHARSASPTDEPGALGARSEPEPTRPGAGATPPLVLEADVGDSEHGPVRRLHGGAGWRSGEWISHFPIGRWLPIVVKSVRHHLTSFRKDARTIARDAPEPPGGRYCWVIVFGTARREGVRDGAKGRSDRKSTRLNS